MQVVGIDVGRDHVKAVSLSKQVKLKSSVGEWRPLRLSNEGKEYEVEINGQKYFVGPLAEESYFIREMATESKIHEETRILFLTALALVAPNDERVRVVTGIPVNQHTPEGKQALAELLSGQHTVKINGRPRAFLVESPSIAPESGGVYWDFVLDMNGRLRDVPLATCKTRVIDIGSRTVNYCTMLYSGGRRRYLDRDSGTLPYGVLEIYNATEQPGDEVLEAFTRRIIADLSKRWLGFRETDAILFAGGGSILLRPWLRDQFPGCYFSADPVFANASGYFKMGMVQSGR